MIVRKQNKTKTDAQIFKEILPQKLYKVNSKLQLQSILNITFHFKIWGSNNIKNLSSEPDVE